jgi:hypothetical protein
MVNRRKWGRTNKKTPANAGVKVQQLSIGNNVAEAF